MKQVALIVVLAACSNGGSKKRAAANDAAPMPAIDAAVVADAASAAPIDAAVASAPPAACDVGEPLELAKAARTPGELDVAVRGEHTAVAWVDGGTSYVTVVDAAGTAVAPAVKLTPKGSYIKETHLFAAPSGFLVVTEEDQIKCYLRVRGLSDAGVLGEPVTLDHDVCSVFGYPQIAMRGELLLILTTHHYEGRGLDLIRWSSGATHEVTSVLPASTGAAPVALSATAAGFAALWSEGEDPGARDRVMAATIAATGAAGKAARFAVSGEDVTLLGLIGATPVAIREHGKVLQARTQKAWVDVGPLGKGHQPELIDVAGRTWLLPDGSSGGHAVPLDEQGAPAGAGFDAPSSALAHDGHRGAALGWSGKQLQLRPLDCR